MSEYRERVIAQERERRERLNAQYAQEPWGRLAIACGFDPYDTESMAREAFAAAAARIEALEARERVLVALLQTCAEHFDGESDVSDGAYGEPVPNEAMSLLSEINRALGTE